MTIDKQIYSIHSLAVSKPVQSAFGNKSVPTAIHKHPIEHRVYLSSTNIDGDEQADKKHHGGPDKAVCAYSYERYSYWENIYGHQLERNQFGENLTLRGITEETACIGDIFSCGEAILQISQPRIPCFKLGIRCGKTDIAERFQKTGFTGFYFRVLQPGYISVNDPFILIEKAKHSTSIKRLNELYFNNHSPSELEKVLQLPTLAKAYKKAVESKVIKIRS